MRKGVILVVIGTALALAGQAQAHRPSLHKRERAVLTRYAHKLQGTVSSCHPRIPAPRQIACTVSVPIYLQPSGLLLGTDSALVAALQAQGAIYTLRISDWTLSEVVPVTTPTLG